MKKMVHAELQNYGDFGLVNVGQNFLYTFSFIFIFENLFLKKLYILFIIVSSGIWKGGKYA